MPDVEEGKLYVHSTWHLEVHTHRGVNTYRMLKGGSGLCTRWCNLPYVAMQSLVDSYRSGGFQNSESTVEPCVRCGMVANLDPSLHEERYGHLPVVRRNGKLLEFDFHRYAFTRELGADED